MGAREHDANVTASGVADPVHGPGDADALEHLDGGFGTVLESAPAAWGSVLAVAGPVDEQPACALPLS